MPDDTSDCGRAEQRTCPVSRRSFLATAVAGGVGAAASNAATATAKRELSAAAATDELSWVVERAGSSRVPTLIEVTNEQALRRVSGVGEGTRTTTEPRPAAYARLTASEVEQVDSERGVETLRFAPGANPFWKLGDSPDRVFPGPTEAVDFIAYEEAIAGIEFLAGQHPDRVAERTIGQTVGIENQFEGGKQPLDVKLVEVTNDVSDRVAFADKRKVVYSIGIHGDERVGAETGLRFLDRLLAGQESDVEALLDDVVLLFVTANPDGWFRRSPLTEGDTFTRTTGSGVDPNRQYPTVGLIDPSRSPAEPDGSDLEDDDPGIDGDVGREYRETVAGELSIVDTLREYDNLGFAADFHGMFGSEYLVEGLLMNNEQSPREQGRIDRFNEALSDRMERTAGDLLEENRQAIEEAARARGRFGESPSEVYDYGTVYETIGYNVSGSLGSWLGDAVGQGGLDATAVSFEMALDNNAYSGQEYRPQLLEVQAAACDAAFREMAVSTAEQADVSIDANGRDGAYVTTDAVERSSEELPFDENTAVKQGTWTVAAGERGLAIPVDGDISMLSIRVTPNEGRPERVRLVDPDGRTLREDDVGRGGFAEHPSWLLTDTAAGEWRLSVTGDRGATATVELTAVAADPAQAPDPREVLGYEQREYSVTPLTYFEDYDDALQGGSLSGQSVDAVANGALLEGGQPAVDQLVVIHDDGTDDRAYVDAIDSYLEAGGELVLTDAGVSLLGELSAGGVSGISGRDINRTTLRFATLDSKNDDPLLDGVRPIERELWTAPTIGYTNDTTPATLVDGRAFERAGGAVAATASGDVIAGRLDAITVIGSVLPPASQENLHPFGLSNYAAGSLGQQLLRNALGHEQ